MQNKIKIEIARIYKIEYGRALATLVRILGSFDHAEDALQEAFRIALEKWPNEGIPQNPHSWIISTAKFKAIDTLRKLKRGRELLSENFSIDEDYHEDKIEESHIIQDDQLRLIFLCCHPVLPLDSRIALSLRDFCGMTTEEIARAYLVSTDTIKKRISRAKAVFRTKNITFTMPSRREINQRLNTVLHVIYLIFNEGYSASSGDSHLRSELTEEAIRLCRKLVELISSAESLGLLALLLFHESRRKARITKNGDIIPLSEQDRSLWNQSFINEGLALLQQSVMSGSLGPYTLQAAIASVHVTADSVQNTRWDIIIGYYDALLSISPSPIVKLNRAIALGMHHGPEVGLAITDELIREDKLNSYHIIHSTRADFYNRLGLKDKAIQSYMKAIELVRQIPERRYLNKKLSEVLAHDSVKPLS